MRFLFIGGNGNISWYCVQRALERGYEVWELNRSMTLKTRRDIQPQVRKLTADIHDLPAVKTLLGDSRFDVVIDFICYNEADAAEAVELFSGKTDHFVFISSDSVYRRAGKNLPFREDCEQNDPERSGKYIAGKVLAERYFREAYEKNGFPVTIIRPTYTYDVIVPVSIGQNCFTAPQKFLEGRPALIAGDGTNLWEFTHSSDFASACVPLAENPDTVGEDIHIATEELLSWNEEMELLFGALGIPRYSAVHVPYEEALELTYFQERDLTAHKMWHNIHDVSKLRKYVPGWHAQVPFEQGIRETIEWLNGADVRRRLHAGRSEVLDRLYKKYGG